MRIEKGQAIGIVYIILVILACLFVPWKIRIGTSSVILGYSFLWSPPSGVIYLRSFNVYIDWVIVSFEIIVITLVALLLYALVLYREKNKI